MRIDPSASEASERVEGYWFNTPQLAAVHGVQSLLWDLSL